MVVPFVILGGFILGIITADPRAGAVVAGYAFLAARLYYRNVSWREMGKIAYDRRDPHRGGGLPARGSLGVSIPDGREACRTAVARARYLGPLKAHPVAVSDRNRGDELPVRHAAGGPARRGRAHPGWCFPSPKRWGSILFTSTSCRTAAVGIGLFLPPMGVGLLMALRFRKSEHRAALSHLCAVHAGAVCRAAVDHLHSGDQPHAAEAGRD